VVFTSTELILLGINRSIGKPFTHTTGGLYIHIYTSKLLRHVVNIYKKANQHRQQQQPEHKHISFNFISSRTFFFL